MVNFDPSDLALVAFTLLLGALLNEAYLTCRDWWRRWRTPARPRPLVVRRPSRDCDDQAPYGHGTSLIG
jgi:hypothetical protein